MQPCPRLPPNIDETTLWHLMSSDPHPRLLSRDSSSPISKDDRERILHGLPEVMLVDMEGQHTLSFASRTPRVFEHLRNAFPLPAAVRSLDLRPHLALGLTGSGETDMAEHWHPVTAMRLLSGVKIWTLRKPGDPDCLARRGECTFRPSTAKRGGG